MSAEATTAVLHHSKSEGSSKLVMWGIANHHSDSGAWPAIATLAKYASVSERRVQQIIRGLATMGEIRIEEQGGFGAHYKTNRYWILIQCPKDCDGSLQHRTGVKSGDLGVKSGDLGVKSGDMRGEAQGHSGVKPVSPEPNKNLIEPIKPNHTQKAHRLPEDFKPSDKNWSEMAEHFGWVDLKKETHHFIDYWLSVPPGKATKVDWQRTWKNWIRTASNHGKPVGSPKKRNKIRAED